MTGKIEFVQFASERRAAYQLRTEIRRLPDGRRIVRKTAMSKDARPHIAALCENHDILARQYGAEHVAPCRLVHDDAIEFDYIKGQSLASLLAAGLAAGNQAAWQERLRHYRRDILHLGESSDDGVIAIPAEGFHMSARDCDLDLTFDNIIFAADGTWQIIDYEWLVPGISRRYILWRALRHFIERTPALTKTQVAALQAEAGAVDEEACLVAERSLYHSVYDANLVPYRKAVYDPAERARIEREQEAAERQREKAVLEGELATNRQKLEELRAQAVAWHEELYAVKNRLHEQEDALREQEDALRKARAESASLRETIAAIESTRGYRALAWLRDRRQGMHSLLHK